MANCVGGRNVSRKSLKIGFRMTTDTFYIVKWIKSKTKIKLINFDSLIVKGGNTEDILFL